MSLAKPGGAQKTKSLVSKDGKKKKRVYSEKELDIPALNGIIPAGIAKPKGVKKGKKFVDDPASMVCIQEEKFTFQAYRYTNHDMLRRWPSCPSSTPRKKGTSSPRLQKPAS
jgi:hypothetical protein